MAPMEAIKPDGHPMLLKCDSNGYLYVNIEGESTNATEGSGASNTGGQVMIEARSSDKAAVDSGDAVRPVADLYGKIATAPYSWADNVNRVKEQNPINEIYLPGKPVDVTSEADGTDYEYIDMAGYRHLSLQLIVTSGSGSVTVTLEGTVQDDGTAASSCTYEDVSSLWGAASWTADAALTDPSGEAANFRYIRIKRVHSTGGADDSGLTVHTKQWN